MLLVPLFHSEIRIKLLRFFLIEEIRFYSLFEISEKIREKISSLRKELKNLQNLGFIKEKKMKTITKIKFNKKEKKRKRFLFQIKKYYQARNDFILYPELKALFLKSQLLLETVLSKRIQKIGQIQLLILTGFFTNLSYTQTDLLIVGRVNRKRLKNLIKKFEKEIGRSINYTVMSTQEFKYRHNLTDRFLFNILESKKIVVINRFGDL